MDLLVVLLQDPANRNHVREEVQDLDGRYDQEERLGRKSALIRSISTSFAPCWRNQNGSIIATKIRKGTAWIGWRMPSLSVPVGQDLT